MAETAKVVTLRDPKTGEAVAPRTVLTAVTGAQTALDGKADLREGKVPAEQLPPMNYVPTTRKVNGKNLTGDITLTASDVGARASNWTPTAAEVGAVPTSRKINGLPLSEDITLNANSVGARSNTWMPSAVDVGADPTGSAAAVAAAMLDALNAHTGNTGNPHGVTAGQIGAAAKDGTGASGTWPINITGIAGGNCRIQTGTYEGTGTYGENNPCRIVSGFSPWIFFVFEYIVPSAIGTNSLGGIIGIRTSPYGGGTLVKVGYSGSSIGSLQILGGSGWISDVSWWSTSAAAQGNEAGRTYGYCIIGQ